MLLLINLILCLLLDSEQIKKLTKLNIERSSLKKC